MNIIMSLMIWAGSVILTVTLFIVEVFLTILLFPFDRKKKILHAQCFWWSNAIIKLNPYWNLKVKGLENIDKKKTYVIVANHQSLADIVVLYKTHMQFKWVAKNSLFKVPFIGWCLSLTHHIRLSRGDFGSIKKVYREAAAWLRKDISVFFFPEGTRSKTGDMSTFQNGAFKLAIKENKQVLPISIRWTKSAIKKGSWVFDSKAVCELTVLSPIEISGFKAGDFGKLRDAAYDRLRNVNP